MKSLIDQCPFLYAWLINENYNPWLRGFLTAIKDQETITQVQIKSLEIHIKELIAYSRKNESDISSDVNKEVTASKEQIDKIISEIQNSKNSNLEM